MVNTELLNKYELAVIVDAFLSAEDKEAVWKEITEVIKKNGGKIINSRVWFEKQKFTFKIKKSVEGTYYLVVLEGEGSVINLIKPVLKLNEKILRFTVTRLE